MTRGVGRTSPNPSAVSGRILVPSHDGGTVPSGGGGEDGEPFGGLGEGPVVAGAGRVLVAVGEPDEVGDASLGRACWSVPQAASPLASRIPTSVSRTRLRTPSTLAAGV
jgi:hypothetical protein